MKNKKLINYFFVYLLVQMLREELKKYVIEDVLSHIISYLPFDPDADDAISMAEELGDYAIILHKACKLPKLGQKSITKITKLLSDDDSLSYCRCIAKCKNLQVRDICFNILLRKGKSNFTKFMMPLTESKHMSIIRYGDLRWAQNELTMMYINSQYDRYMARKLYAAVFASHDLIKIECFLQMFPFSTVGFDYLDDIIQSAKSIESYNIEFIRILQKYAHSNQVKAFLKESEFDINL